MTRGRALLLGLVSTGALAALLFARGRGEQTADEVSARGSSVATAERAAPPSRVRPPTGAKRLEPRADPEAPTTVSGRLRTSVEAEVQHALRQCSSRSGSRGTRVFVTFDVVVADRVSLGPVHVAGGDGLAELETCVGAALARLELEPAVDATPGRFLMTVSLVLGTT